MPGAARVPRGQRAAQRQGQAQIGRQRQRDAFQRQAGLRDGGVDDGHQVLVADGDGQRAVLDQRQALIGVRRQRHARGIGRDHEAQDVRARQRQRLSGLDQPRRHRAHRGAHDVGDIGGMEHRQADDQRGEFDAGLPAALQAQSAPDRQFDDGRGQEGPGEQLAASASQGATRMSRTCPRCAGPSVASRRRRIAQPAINMATIRLAACGSQPCSAGSASPRLDSSTDGSGSQAWRASGRRSSRPYQTKSCNSTGVLRSGAMMTAASRDATGSGDRRASQRHAQQRGQGQGGQRHRQRVDQAGRQRHPVGILGQHVEQAFRDAKARGLEQEAEAAVHACARPARIRSAGPAARPVRPGPGSRPARRASERRAPAGRARSWRAASGFAPPARAGRRQRASLERRRVQQAALVPLRVQAALASAAWPRPGCGSRPRRSCPRP